MKTPARWPGWNILDKIASLSQHSNQNGIILVLYVAYVYANEQLGPCLYVLVRYSLLFSSEIRLKLLFADGEVNIVE